MLGCQYSSMAIIHEILPHRNLLLYVHHWLCTMFTLLQLLQSAFIIYKQMIIKYTIVSCIPQYRNWLDHSLEITVWDNNSMNCHPLYKSSLICACLFANSSSVEYSIIYTCTVNTIRFIPTLVPAVPLIQYVRVKLHTKGMADIALIVLCITVLAIANFQPKFYKLSLSLQQSIIIDAYCGQLNTYVKAEQRKHAHRTLRILNINLSSQQQYSIHNGVN